MQKQAPSIGRILVAVGFALSCFGLLLFLWVAFGGPIPLKPKSYQFSADFPEATTLAIEADVRIGGVSVGKVKTLELPDEGNATRATIEIEPEFAPIAEDTRAILRQKTLLGETYIELTPGSKTDAGAPVSLGAQGGATDAESPRAATCRPRRSKTRPRSTRSSTRSTSRPASPSSAGRQTPPSRSKTAAST